MKYMTNPPYLLVKSKKIKQDTQYNYHMSFVGKDSAVIEVYNLLATTEEEGKNFKLKNEAGHILTKEGGQITDANGSHKETDTVYTLQEIFDHYELMAPPITPSHKVMAYFYFKLKPGLTTSMDEREEASGGEASGGEASGGSRKLKKKTKKLKRK